MRKLLFLSAFALLGTFVLASTNDSNTGQLDDAKVILTNDPCAVIQVNLYETLISAGFNEDAACSISEFAGNLCDMMK